MQVESYQRQNIGKFYRGYHFVNKWKNNNRKLIYGHSCSKITACRNLQKGHVVIPWNGCSP